MRSPTDHLHRTPLEWLTALMLKEGGQPRCGAGTQVSWVWRSGCLQAGVGVVLFRPGLPTQLSFHFAAQQHIVYRIILTAFHRARQPWMHQLQT